MIHSLLSSNIKLNYTYKTNNNKVAHGWDIHREISHEGNTPSSSNASATNPRWVIHLERRCPGTSEFGNGNVDFTILWIPRCMVGFKNQSNI